MTEAVNRGLLDRLRNLRSLWRDSAPRNLPASVSPDLSAEESDLVKAQMQECLQGRGGEVSARGRAAALGQVYLGLSAQGRERFLALLAKGFGPDPAEVDRAIEAVRNASEHGARVIAEGRLKTILEPPRLKLLTQFNALPEGVKFLVDLRAELLPLARNDADLKALERDLKGLLASWFDVGFLELRRVTWRSPALLLEKIMAYEAVHAIHSWDDLKNRLDSDRRLYAFFHPRMPDEPLIFVEVALVKGMAANVQDLLDETAPVEDPTRADTAIFYSISNAQKGLAGISFGNFLIKRVVDSLAHEFPNLKHFATLSPIPGFRAWLDEKLKAGEPGLLTQSEHRALVGLGEGRGAKGSLKAILDQPDWFHDPLLGEGVRGPLTRLAARYLALEPPQAHPHKIHRALDPVAHFHLSNGARMERLNWLGDASPKGIAQSAGMMINYAYRLNEIDANHEAYRGRGRVAMSKAVKALMEE